MSFDLNYANAQEAGFSAKIDRETARRQFNMSLGLVVVLALAALAAIFTLRIEPLNRQVTAQNVQLVVQAPMKVMVRHADNTARPGI